MAGIYIHIPFCKQACHYCDFHFSTNLKHKDSLLEAIIRELDLQQNYLAQEKVSSIYFGGGTPSILHSGDIDKIIDRINTHHQVTTDVEITLEANPDDLTKKKLRELSDAGVNRLSIGIQSFHDQHLRYMNRAHNAKEASQCVEWAYNTGIKNLSIDLIYGIPANDHQIWRRDLELAVSLPVNHISAYCLTIEPDTAFGRWVAQNKMAEAGEEFSAEQFELLLDTLNQHGFEQYEISSFCKDKQYSRHNSSYWLQKKYLGVGPSAHSYNGGSRQFNVSHN
ncbi:MAG: radical SAM family heme chaperone HemW, partial [Bacteroidota bacterium]